MRERRFVTRWRRYHEIMFPNYGTPEEAVKAYLYMYWYRRILSSSMRLLPNYRCRKHFKMDGKRAFEMITGEKARLKALIQKVMAEGRALLNEGESKAFLAAYHIPTTIPSTAHNEEEALAIASKIGFPVVIKIVSPDITHKTDVGGVAVGIRSEEQLKQAYERMMTAVKERVPKAIIEGISVKG